MTAGEIIARLEGVRARGPGRWTARCPAHEDRTPSLSIRELDDGTILLHCFALCEALAICHAIGLHFSDLFPARHVRRIDDRERPRLAASDALAALGHEAAIVTYIAADLVERRKIDDETWQRLALAYRRISSACCATGAWR